MCVCMTVMCTYLGASHTALIEILGGYLEIFFLFAYYNPKEQQKVLFLSRFQVLHRKPYRTTVISPPRTPCRQNLGGPC